jgi:hypothetical protein
MVHVPLALATALLLLALARCGQPAGPYETAGLEIRSSGGDEVISEEGEGFGTDSGPGLAAPFSTRDAFHDALLQAKARREGELAQLAPQAPIHRRLRGELVAIDYKLRNLDLSFLQQRNAFVLAQGSLSNFVYQYAPDREWEIAYAIRSGEAGLSASIVQDVLNRFETAAAPPLDHIDVPQEEAALDEETDAPIRDMAAARLRAETLGADALLKLAQLAIEAADFVEAERQFRACLEYESDLTVRADALNSYAALLELLGRDDEAREMDAIAARTLDGSR